MKILTSTKTDLKNRKLNLPIVGIKTFDENGQLLLEDDNEAQELIDATEGSIDLVDIEAIKSKVEADDLGNGSDLDDQLSTEQRTEKLINKINEVNFKELKLLAGSLTKGVEGIKYTDWANLRKEALQQFLLNLITPNDEGDIDTAAGKSDPNLSGAADTGAAGTGEVK